MTSDETPPYLHIDEACIACGWCSYNCPVDGCITFEAEVATIHADLCIACDRCVDVCPVNAITHVKETRSRRQRATVRPVESFDIVVIGAGMGGMLSACRLAQAGRRVLLVEALSFLGGRFTGFRVNGALVPSGALHLVPHGRKGPFAKALRRVGVRVPIRGARTFASFHIGGRHIVGHTSVDALRIFSSAGEALTLFRGLLQAWFVRKYEGSFGAWMVEIGMPDLILTLLDRFFQFSLSAGIDDVPYREGREIIAAIFRYGLPGVPQGGAAEIARQLGGVAERAGVVIRRRTRAVQILRGDGGHVRGVALYDRRHGERYEIEAPTIVSTIGPGRTLDLWDGSDVAERSHRPASLDPPAAVGLKLQVLSPRSLIHHDAIMFCLDTRRVAGIVQVSNRDPGLAPPGKHLLISHQVIPPGADWREERALALEDWRGLFGSAFDDCEVLGSSHFPARFPVNWASQGYDLRVQPFAEQGLWLVGDAVKPEGSMMVEGVAASADAVVRQVLGE